MATRPVNRKPSRRLDDWLTAALAPLVEGDCRLCRDHIPPGAALCQPCRDALPWHPGGCPYCADPHTPGRICGACLSQRPAFTQVIPAFTYTHEVAQLIRRFKHRGDLSAGRLLADELASTLPGDLPEALVPVPLNRARRHRRGFNQASEIARRLPGHIRYDIARRQRLATPQRLLAARQRAHNIRHAFAITEPPPPRVAIIDDVVTTGATVRELARALWRAGASEVVVCALARA